MPLPEYCGSGVITPSGAARTWRGRESSPPMPARSIHGYERFGSPPPERNPFASPMTCRFHPDRPGENCRSQLRIHFTFREKVLEMSNVDVVIANML